MTAIPEKSVQNDLPTKRSAFVIEPTCADSEPSQPICYGDNFRLRSLLFADDDSVARGLLQSKPPCYLASVSKSERVASRLTNRQLVFVSSGTSSESFWVFERAVFNQGLRAAEDKFFSNKQPVQVCALIYALHMFFHEPTFRRARL